MISVTITDRSGRTLSGQTVEAFWISVAPRAAVQRRPQLRARRRARCGRTSPSSPRVADTARQLLPERRAARTRSASTTSSRRDDRGHPRASSPTRGLAQHRRRLLRHDAGAHPRDRRGRGGRRAARAAGRLPRADAQLQRASSRSRSAPTANFQMIGERTNVTGSAKFARLDQGRRLRRRPSRSPSTRCAAARTSSTSTWTRACSTAEAAMTRFLNLIATEPEIARIPIMIDSSKWSVIEAGLKCVQGKAVVNSISLKEGEAEFLEQAALVRRYGAAVVVMAFDEQGQADTTERKVAICERAYKLLDRAGRLPTRGHHLRPEHPRDRDRHRGAQRLREELHRGDARDQGDAVPASQVERRRQQPVVLVPRQRPRPRGDARGVPLPRDPGRHGHGHRQRRAARSSTRTSRRTCSSASRTSCSTAAPTRPSGWSSSPSRSRARARSARSTSRWREAPVEERLAHALVHGIVDFIEADVEEARQKLRPAARRSSRAR